MGEGNNIGDPASAASIGSLLFSTGPSSSPPSFWKELCFEPSSLMLPSLMLLALTSLMLASWLLFDLRLSACRDLACLESGVSEA